MCKNGRSLITEWPFKVSFTISKVWSLTIIITNNQSLACHHWLVLLFLYAWSHRAIFFLNNIYFKYTLSDVRFLFPFFLSFLIFFFFLIVNCQLFCIETNLKIRFERWNHRPLKSICSEYRACESSKLL